jgi:phage terminase large subunit-like protein
LGLNFDMEVHGDILYAVDQDDYDEGYVYLPRGCFKSHLLCAFTCRHISADRNYRAFFLGVTQGKTAEDTQLLEQFLESDKVVNEFGDFFNREHWNKDSFTVLGRTRPMKEPTLTTFGRENFKPGGHFDFKGVDDIEDQDTVNTPELIAKTRQVDSLSYPMVDEPGAKSLYFGTFYDDNDLYNHKMRKFHLHKGKREADGTENVVRVPYIRREVELEMDDGSKETRRVFQFWKPATKDDGTALFPARLPLSKLASIRAGMDATTYASQYELDPIAVANAEFKASTFRFMDTLPKKPLECYILGDFARSMRSDGDYTGYTVLWIDEDFQWYITESYRSRIDQEGIIERIVHYATLYPDAHHVYEQDPFVEGMTPQIMEALFAKHLSPRITWIKSGGRKSKDSRISALAPLFKAGRVYLFPGTSALQQELVRFPKGSRRDVMDSLANALKVAQSSAPAYPDAQPDPRDADPAAPWNNLYEIHTFGEDVNPYEGFPGEEVPDRWW